MDCVLIDHLEKLKHFIGAAEAGSIRSYCLRASLSQSAISKSIQTLETALDTGLFIRDKNGVTLTESGYILREFAEKLLQDTSRTETDLRTRKGEKLTGSLCLGTYQSIAVYLLPRFFTFLSQRHPDLKLKFVSGPSSDLIEKVLHGQIDAALSIDPPDKQELFSTLLYQDHYSLYHRVGLKINADTPIFSLRLHADEKFLQEASTRRAIIECGDFEAVKSMVSFGAGLGFMPDLVAALQVEAQEFTMAAGFPQLTQVGKHGIYFSSRRHRESDVVISLVRRDILKMLKVGTAPNSL